MNLNELGKKLYEMYHNAESGESVAMNHLFAIKYSDEIRQGGATMKEVSSAGSISESYGTEISKGVKLSKCEIMARKTA